MEPNMTYLFPYAGYDGPKRKPLSQSKEARKHRLRVATRALRVLESEPELTPQQRISLEAAVNAEYVPTATSGLPPSYRKILSEVALKHKVPYKSILGVSQLAHISQARRAFIFRCMEEIPNASYAGVGRYLKRDHTTVIYAHKKGLADPSSMEPLERRIVVHKNKSSDGFSFFEAEVTRLIKEGLNHVQVAKQLSKTPKQITSALCEVRRKASKMGCTDIPPDFGRVAKRIRHD
jgi:hypothetical protein